MEKSIEERRKKTVWGRPKGTPQSTETKNKISAGVKATYLRYLNDLLKEDKPKKTVGEPIA